MPALHRRVLHPHRPPADRARPPPCAAAISDQSIRRYRFVARHALRANCVHPLGQDPHDAVGYNYRLSNLSAALGLAQLERLNYAVRAKRKIARRYSSGLGRLPLRTAPRANWAHPSYWFYSLMIYENLPGPEQVTSALATQGIQTRRLWPTGSLCVGGPPGGQRSRAPLPPWPVSPEFSASLRGQTALGYQSTRRTALVRPWCAKSVSSLVLDDAAHDDRWGARRRSGEASRSHAV